MTDIESKRKELEEEAKADLEMGTKDKAWQIEYVASKNTLEGFNLGVEMARKEFLDKSIQMLQRILGRLQDNRIGYYDNEHYIKSKLAELNKIKQSLGENGK